MKKIVFLDLEETVIVSWHDRILCNIEKVKGVLDSLDIREVSIFSFAIDNQKDVDEFNTPSFKGQLEKALDVRIDFVPSVEEIMKSCFRFSGNDFQMYEFKSIWGKTRAFHDFCNAKFKDCECYLLDDVVQNTTFINHDKNLTIKTIRI